MRIANRGAQRGNNMAASDETVTRPRSHTVGVLSKAVDVLEALVFGEAQTLREIAEASGIEKAAVYRILNTLEERGLAIRDAHKRYVPGPQLLAMSSALMKGQDVVADLLPVMNDLRDEFHETVNLGALVGDHIQYLAIVESPLSLRMTAEVGSLHSARSTALGKAILASLDDDQLRFALGADMPDGDEARILQDDLQQTRDRGYAIDFEENERGAICVAAIVGGAGHGRQHALSVSGPITRMTPPVIERLGARLRELSARSR